MNESVQVLWTELGLWSGPELRLGFGLCDGQIKLRLGFWLLLCKGCTN